MKKKTLIEHQPLLLICLSILTLCCLLPLVLIIIVSFSSSASVSQNGFSFFPSELSLEAWKNVLEYKDQILQGYKVTLFEVFAGTAVTLICTSMFAYALSRKNWKLRGFMSGFLLITMLFNGGLVSSYIIYTNVYHLKDNLLVLILPGAVTAYNCFIMRTFIQGNIPEALIESARIDGAGEGYLFFKIILPLMKPTLAAIGFMSAVAHWNEWQTSMLYMNDPAKSTLQLLLIRIENNLEFLMNNREILTPEQIEQLRNAPAETTRMAILCVTMGPILIAYPFFQRYFIKGITVGAVKG